MALLLSCLLVAGLHAGLRETLFDVRFKLLARPASGDIVLVEIDPRSIAAVGQWPWPRGLHGRVLGQFDKAGVSDIVFDVDFSAPSLPAEDAAFAAALQAAGGSVVLAAFRQRVADRGDGVVVHVNRPIAALAQHSWLGLVNVRPDADGIIRGYNYGAVIEGEFIPSVGALLAGRHEQAGRPFRIDFGISSASVPTVSYSDVLNGEPRTLAALRGKKVIVAGTAAELGDRFTVPNGRILPGSLIQALAAESIAQGRALTTTARGVSLSLVALLILVMALSWTRLRTGQRLLVLAGLVLAGEAAALVLQAHQPVALDTSLFFAAALAYACVAAIDEIDLRGLLRLVAERRFQQVAMSLSDGLICADKHGRITLWNPGASRIFGYRSEDSIGLPFAALLATGSDFALNKIPSERLREPGGLIVELVGQRRSGERFDLECSLSSWDAADGIQYGAVLRDVSVRKRQQERIRHLAERDQVTGLANRNSLLTALAGAAHSRTLMLVSVDRLRDISDLHGSAFGDALMRAVADRLDGFAPDAELIARLAEDEFAIILTDGEPLPQARAEGIIEAFRAHLTGSGNSSRRISVSIGLAGADGAISAEEIVGNAHFALAKAKASGTVVHYQPAMREAVKAREALEAELRRALARGEFELFYQPQIALRGGRIVGAEALIRWRHPQRGYISPGEFLPVVNMTSLSEGVAAFVLDSACRQAAAWQQRGQPIRIGVNLTQSQFQTGGLIADVARALRDHSLDPRLLELEVTEDIILDSGQNAQTILAGLRELGVKIAFDDFGTGYGSLTYLKAFPLDTIKIDQTFVNSLQPGSDDAAIVSATISLGHALGLSVIAEGIETEATAKMLAKLGCDEGQGYLIGKPVPASVFEATFFEQQKRRA